MTFILDLALAVLAISLAVAVGRVLVGPTTADRALGLELAGVNLLAIMGAWSLRSGHTDFFDAMLVLGAISFVGTIAIANYMTRGRPIDDDRG